MKVIVMGAGVVGVTTAYFLARAGHKVMVVDKNPASAMGCSYANGGQLSYSHVETWAAKASLISMLKAAVTSGSFLSISDFFNKNFFRWANEFYKNSSPERSEENSKKLFKLSRCSKHALAEILEAEKDIFFDYKKQGILHFYRDQKKFELAIKEAQFFNSIGCKAHVLNAEECVKKEPTLVKLFDEGRLSGGIFYDDDGSGNCLLFVRSLERVCKEKYGVLFEYNTDVRNIFTNYKKVTGVNTSKGVFVANKYVCAFGAYGDRILNGIGINPNIYPLKGYSLSIDANKEFIAPSMTLTDPENKIVYSRIGDVFRAAGTVEIAGLRNSRNKQHINFLKSVIFSTFSDFGNFNEVSDWFGFRPFRPNSIPLICEVKKYENLLLNIGHGSLGWTLSAASGKIIANLVSGKKDEDLSFLEEEEKSLYPKSL